MSRKTGLERRKPTKEPKPRILIVCEGEITEPQYLDGVVEMHRNSLVEVEIVPGAGSPKTLVEIAVLRKKEAQAAALDAEDNSLLFNQVWCVFDVDDHPKIPDAKQQAKAHGINLAISNPSIELWLLIHFSDCRAWISRQNAAKALKTHIPKYNKHVDVRQLLPKYDDAVRRAKVLRQDRRESSTVGDNPSTNFDVLTNEIKKNGIE
jgi:hypothetical protein